MDQSVSSWRRSLRARNRSGRTIQSYIETAEQFAAWTDLQENLPPGPGTVATAGL